MRQKNVRTENLTPTKRAAKVPSMDRRSRLVADIKATMAEQEISVYRLAKMASVNRVTAGNFINLGRDITSDNLLAILEALNYEIRKK